MEGNRSAFWVERRDFGGMDVFEFQRHRTYALTNIRTEVMLLGYSRDDG